MTIPKSYRGDKLRRAADSTPAIVFARFVMPIGLGVIGLLATIVGWFASNTLNDIKASFVTQQIAQATDKKEMWTYIGKLGDRVGDVAVTVSAIKANIDNQEHRLGVLEGRK